MAYSLSTHYAGLGLLDSFQFFTGEDPSDGFVNYLNREEATARNLVSVDELNRLTLGVDSTNIYSTSDIGRPSVRVTSNDHFTHGLFIADFAHMPSSTCGTWPAFWAFNTEGNGSSWPQGGEVNIIEGANTAQRNLFSAHATSGCRAPRTGFIGAQGSFECSSGDNGIGCNYAAPSSDSATYGDAFNAQGGGIYALEWDARDIRIWHFPRTAIPADIGAGPPDPSTWGPAHALFGGSNCEADSYFFRMNLVINTNFCGEYAGNAWGRTDHCNELAPTCEEYVAANPSSFVNSFWQINYIDVYQKPPGAEANGTSSSFSSSTRPQSNVAAIQTVAAPLSASTTTVVTPTRTRTVTITRAISSTAEPSQKTGDVSASSSRVNEWVLLGCFDSAAAADNGPFSAVASFAGMNRDACVASCAGRKYAGISGETCYCADSLSNATSIANEKCITAVATAAAIPADTSTTISVHPGSHLRLNPHHPRSTVLPIIVYASIDTEMPPGAPGKGKSKGFPSPSPSPSPTPHENVVAITSTITITFTTLCATDAKRLATLEYSTTMTVTGRPGMVTASIPMTTYAETCEACGPEGESTVTFTVPRAFAVGKGGGGHHVMATTSVHGHGIFPLLHEDVPLPSPSFSVTGSSAVVPAIDAGATSAGGAGTFSQTFNYGVVLSLLIVAVGIIL